MGAMRENAKAEPANDREYWNRNAKNYERSMALLGKPIPHIAFFMADAALSALIHVLKPGGRVIVPTFCHAQTLLSHVASRLLSFTGLAGLRAALEAKGISIKRTRMLPGIIPIGYIEGVPTFGHLEVSA